MTKTTMNVVLLLLLVVVVSHAFVVAPTRLSNAAATGVQTLSNRRRDRAGSSVVVFMGWGPEPIWSPATVKSNADACKSGQSVSITLSLDKASSEYTTAGQYVQLRLDGEMEKPLFLAIASAPEDDADEYEFLIKKTDNNDWITDAKSGIKVEMSQVLGNGFPMSGKLDDLTVHDFPTQNVMLFCAGSGIAPIKAAMESGDLSVGEAGRTARLYYGERTSDDLCFSELFDEWEKAGFQVVPVLSQPNDEWDGRSGYIQNALEEDGVPIPRNSGALLCGMKGMAESVTDLLTKAGVYEEKILTNF